VTDRITTPFTGTSTASKVLEGVDLSGRRVVVTGGSSGIGKESARALAAAGADVTIAVRDTGAGDVVASEIASSTGRKVAVAPLDLADRSSIASFVAAWDGALDVLVGNAAVMGVPLTRTVEGWELHFATNHLGHFALATGLRSALALAGDARIVSLSSVEHRRSPIDFDDAQFERRPYEAQLAYAQSKTANALFAVEADRRWAADGIRVNAVMPGAIMTNLMRHIDPVLLRGIEEHPIPGLTWKTVEQGAATSVLVAASPFLYGLGGRYFEDCNEAVPADEASTPFAGVADHALDPASAARLWRVSEELLLGGA
jgi:NAD(P)-dependent dehydrogenase (short-subunit alcohol dehydrogenase family)